MEALNQVVDVIEEREAVMRSKPRGKWIPVETNFDRAHNYLKIFELTKDVDFLKKHISPFMEQSVRQGKYMKWRFSEKMPELEFDIDTIAYFLLHFGMAETNGLDVPEQFSLSRNLEQVELLVDESGGVKTWFRDFRNDVDPIVNVTVWWAYEISRKHNSVSERIGQYLNSAIKQASGNSNVSRYYAGTIYLCERLAKASRYNPHLLADEAIQSLDGILLSSKPANTLERAQLSKALSLRGYDQRPRELNDELIETQQRNGMWPICTFYRQNTPRYNFGSAMHVTLTVVEALKMQEQGLEKVHY